jgi:hypothetical protein
MPHNVDIATRLRQLCSSFCLQYSRHVKQSGFLCQFWCTDGAGMLSTQVTLCTELGDGMLRSNEEHSLRSFTQHQINKNVVENILQLFAGCVLDNGQSDSSVLCHCCSKCGPTVTAFKLAAQFPDDIGYARHHPWPQCIARGQHTRA